MKCGGMGEVPSVDQTCSLKCGQRNGVVDCVLDPCACTKAGLVCSSGYPTDCKYEANIIMKCDGDRLLPTKDKACDADHYCATEPNPVGTICKPLCNCTGTVSACSTEFKPVCKLPPQGVFKCTSEGKVEPVEVCQGTDVCIKTLTGAECTPPECICVNDAVARCGSTFPARCKLTAGSLYECKKGSLPSLKDVCNPGVCVSSGSATLADICVKPCECMAAGSMCSSEFASSCGFPPKTLLTCSGTGAKPIVSETCTLECVSLPRPARCKFDPCSCPEVGSSCGSSYPASCGYTAQAFYTCKAKGALPETPVACKGDEVCVSVTNGPDLCKQGSCECKGTGSSCGDKFPSDCNVARKDVVSCPAKTTTSCANGCVDGTCSTSCLCTSTGFRCGSSFGSQCNVAPNALYKCVVGSEPVFERTCDDKTCQKGSPDDSCANPCLCRSARPTCGSAFPTSCGFAGDTLYQCSGSGATPTTPTACTRGCLFTSPDNSCKLDCVAQVTSATAQIDVVLEAIALVPDAAGVFPPVVQLLKEAKTKLLADKDNATLLAQDGVLLKSTVNATLGILSSISALRPANSTIIYKAVVTQLTLLQPLAVATINCAGGNPDGCIGHERLYPSYANSFTSRAPSLVVGTTAQKTAVQAAIDEMRTILTDLNAAKTEQDLARPGKRLNELISKVSLDEKTYGIMGELLELIHASMAELLKCAGLKVPEFMDKCSVIKDRAKGYLTYIFQYFKTIFAQLSLGFVANPLLDAISTLVNTALKATDVDITGLSNIAAELLYLLQFIAPANIQPELKILIDKIRTIQDAVAVCTGVKDCYGPISFLVTVLKVPANLIDGILFCTFLNIGANCAPGKLLRQLIDQIGNLGKGAVGTTVPAILATVDLLKNAVCFTPLVNVLCPILEYVADALRRIAVCIDK
ncbi:hypothetical protein BGZ94_001382 [Podila epigama]|nr:hypothetical protein BGZ94_001382 [Podila epigama]